MCSQQVWRMGEAWRCACGNSLVYDAPLFTALQMFLLAADWTIEIEPYSVTWRVLSLSHPCESAVFFAVRFSIGISPFLSQLRFLVPSRAAPVRFLFVRCSFASHHYCFVIFFSVFLESWQDSAVRWKFISTFASVFHLCFLYRYFFLSYIFFSFFSQLAKSFRTAVW